jgi:hypothetical protein
MRQHIERSETWQSGARTTTSPSKGADRGLQEKSVEQAVLNAMALINVDTLKYPQTGKQIPNKGVITCSTKAVIYLITCPCGKTYVGKTKRELKLRISERRSTIRCKNSTYPVTTHFLEANQSIPPLRYNGIEHVTFPRRDG